MVTIIPRRKSEKLRKFRVAAYATTTAQTIYTFPQIEIVGKSHFQNKRPVEFLGVQIVLPHFWFLLTYRDASK